MLNLPLHWKGRLMLSLVRWFMQIKQGILPRPILLMEFSFPIFLKIVLNLDFSLEVLAALRRAIARAKPTIAPRSFLRRKVLC